MFGSFSGVFFTKHQQIDDFRSGKTGNRREKPMKKSPGSGTGAKIQRKSASVLEPKRKFDGKVLRF